MIISVDKIGLQYTFHLKTLEYAKKSINAKIKALEGQKGLIRNQIEALAIPREIPPPNCQKPSLFFALFNSAKWAFLIICILLVSKFLYSHPIIKNYVSTPNLFDVLIFNVLLIAIPIAKINSQYHNYKNLFAEYEGEWKLYRKRCEEDQQRVESEKLEQGKKQEEIEDILAESEDLKQLLENVKKARDLLYSVNYIPYQFRNLESISFFYSQIQSSPITLRQLILFDTQKVKDGYKDIPDFIKVRDEIYLFYNVKNPDFWDSCKQLTSEVVKSMQENDENKLAKGMETLIDTMKNSTGTKYIGNIYGGYVESNSGTILNNNIQNNIPDSVINEARMALSSEPLQKIVDTIGENTQISTQEHDEIKSELLPKPDESQDTWQNRIQEFIGTIADISTIIQAIKPYITELLRIWFN